MICCGKQLFASVRSQTASKGGLRPFSHPLPNCKTDEKKRNLLDSDAVRIACLLRTRQRYGRNQRGDHMVTSYFDPLTKLIFAVAAVLGLVGGVRVYSKFNSGDPDASKSATALFLSCVFLVIVGTVLRSFFL